MGGWRIAPLLFCLFVVLSVIIGIAVVVLGFSARERKIHVTVANRSPESLSEVVVHVTGNSYALGNLAVGEFGSVLVRPTSESHVEVEFVDYLKQRKRFNAGGYFESGYLGTIEIEVKAAAIVCNEHRVQPSYSPY